MVRHGLDYIFKPRGVAVVGASNTAGTVGKAVMENLIAAGFPGKLYPVNVKPVTFPGYPSYPSISAIEEPVDLAIIMVPGPIVPDVMHQVGKAGIKGVIIISAGFKEAGPEGKKLEEEVAKIALDHNITLVGPNCLGVLNPHAQLNASFAGRVAPKGEVACVSQSGALCTAVLDVAHEYGIGFSKFISIGNKATLHELEILQYLADDPETKTIMLYTEGLAHDAAWVESVKRITLRHANPKPIIVLKAGRTSEGAAAAKSHTGSLAGDDQVYSSFFEQTGIMQVDTLADWVATAQIVSNNPVVPQAGLAIITNAGGPGIIAADTASSAHIPKADLSDKTRNALLKMLPPSASAHNPVDVLGDADAARYAGALEIVLQDANVGMALAIITPQAMTDALEIAQAISLVRQKFPKKIVAMSFFGDELVHSGVQWLHQKNIATVQFPDQAIRALGHMYAWGYRFTTNKLQNTHSASFNSRAKHIITQAMSHKQTSLDPIQAQELLQACGIPVVTSRLAKNATEAASIVHSINRPVVFKVVSPQILHKTDVGGVALHVTQADAARAFSDLVTTVKKHEPKAAIEGVLVQEMMPLEQELIIGGKQDPVFGPVVLVGMGGVYVHVLRDVSTRVLPITTEDIEQMINKLKAIDLLRGVRGQNGVDLKAVVEIIHKTAQLLMHCPEIQELDFNPVIVGKTGQGAHVVDARIILHQKDVSQ